MPDAAPKKPRDANPAYALIYANLLPYLRVVAREHGYALAVHGSMRTDLDLIACPWVDDAAPAEVLIEAIREHVNGRIEPYAGTNPDDRSHGRRAWAIYIHEGGGLPYLDVSVMPLRP